MLECTLTCVLVLTGEHHIICPPYSAVFTQAIGGNANERTILPVERFRITIMLQNLQVVFKPLLVFLQTIEDVLVWASFGEIDRHNLQQGVIAWYAYER